MSNLGLLETKNISFSTLLDSVASFVSGDMTCTPVLSDAAATRYKFLGLVCLSSPNPYIQSVAVFNDHFPIKWGLQGRTSQYSICCLHESTLASLPLHQDSSISVHHIPWHAIRGVCNYLARNTGMHTSKSSPNIPNSVTIHEQLERICRSNIIIIVIESESCKMYEQAVLSANLLSSTKTFVGQIAIMVLRSV